MSQLTLVLLIGVAGWLAWRTYGRPKQAAPRPAKEPEAQRTIKATTLERDPRTGVYRAPADDEG